MKDQMEYLVRLQAIDTRLGLLKAEAARIPERVEAARRLLLEAQRRLVQSQTEGEASARQKREKERELEACEEKLSKARNRQSEIKTNKEYQAHLQEIESLKLEKGRVEEELLVLMDQVETSKREEAERARIVKDTEQKFERERQQLEKQSETLKTELETSEKEREATVPIMDPKLLKMYQQLKDLHHDLAVVPIQRGTCGGCHMNIPPQRVAEVKTRERILTCSECQRIIYWPVLAELPTAINETGFL